MAELERVVLSGILSKDASFSITVQGGLYTQREAERLISVLRVMRDWMIEDEAREVEAAARDEGLRAKGCGDGASDTDGGVR